MQVARTISELKRWLRRHSQGSRGLVPTLGDLHEGHASLFRRSVRENDRTVVSIYVNPSQFDQRKDFLRYRRDLRGDLRRARDCGVDLAFVPREREITPPGFQTWVEVTDLTRGLCGPRRPGHFRGVATVVAQLFHLVQPDRAYFGRKDYQQLRVVERLVRDLHWPIRIVPCPTLRAPDGLALSSRNRRLSAEERLRASRIYAALLSGGDMIKSQPVTSFRALNARFRSVLRPGPRDRIEYFEAVHPQTLRPLKRIRPPAVLACAVWIGATRLIDNLELPAPRA